MNLSNAKHKVTKVERSNHKYLFSVKGSTLLPFRAGILECLEAEGS